MEPVHSVPPPAPSVTWGHRVRPGGQHSILIGHTARHRFASHFNNVAVAGTLTVRRRAVLPMVPAADGAQARGTNWHRRRVRRKPHPKPPETLQFALVTSYAKDIACCRYAASRRRAYAPLCRVAIEVSRTPRRAVARTLARAGALYGKCLLSATPRCRHYAVIGYAMLRYARATPKRRPRYAPPCLSALPLPAKR